LTVDKDGRVGKCFAEKKDKFSAKCQQQLTEGKAEAADAMMKARQQKAQGETDAKP